jgi:hypothetical protein
MAWNLPNSNLKVREAGLMKDKKFIIVLSVIAVIFSGYFCNHHFGSKKETVEHSKDKNNRLVAMAKSNPRSGLAQMARALKKHYAEKKFYPTNLKALYPIYVNNKEFIEGVNWKYQRRGNSFYLSKTVTRDGKRLMASIDQSLIFGSGEKTMVAKAESEPSRPSTPNLNFKKPKSMPKNVRAKVSQAPQPIKTMEFDDFGIRPHLKGTLDERLEAIVESDASKSESEQPGELAEAIFENADSPKDEILAHLSGRYLIWKDKDGKLGFSNIQYPEKSNIKQVLIEGEWRRFRN